MDNQNQFQSSIGATLESEFIDELIAEFLASPLSTEKQNQFQSSNGATLESEFSDELIAEFLASPLSTENQVGATSQIQEKDSIANFDLLIDQLLNENSPLFQGFDISNEFPNISQALDPNITGNNTLSDINNQASMDSSSVQIYPVEERTIIDMGIPDRQIVTSDTSTLLPPFQNDRIINSYPAWNSSPLHNQFSAVDVNDSQYNPNYMWLEQPMGMQTHQELPIDANRVTTQREKAIVPESSSASRTPPNFILNIGNQNATPMVPSAGPSNAIMTQQNQRQNLQIGRTNSSPREGPNTGLSLQPSSNNAPENQVVQNQDIDLANQLVYMSYSLYDPIFEAFGLAPDPHIRLFLEQKGQRKIWQQMSK